MHTSTTSRVPVLRRWRWQAATSALLALVFVLSACGTGNTSTGHSGGATTGFTHIGNAGLSQPGVLKWGEDSTGGMPYIAPKDSNNPNAAYYGFEVDIANAIAKQMGVQQQPTQITWSNWPQGLASNQFDMFMNGLEISSDNAQSATFSIPYYVYTQSIVVLKTNTTINTLSDLVGKTVETGTGYHAQDILNQWNSDHPTQTIKIVTSDNPTPFTDLQSHRVDAFFLDTPIAAWYGAQDPSGLYKIVGGDTNPGYYAIAFSRSNPNTPTLKKEVNEAITNMWLDGTLAKVYKTGGAYNTGPNNQAVLQQYGMWTDSEKCIANFILINPTHDASCPALLPASQK
ncbi:MAG: transporter substrate-binding domain-containing protein [Ktedonobacterales bacterium]